ncbi:putative pyruvate formate lyase activating enzyme [Geosmithia morbida]|uniref:Pyruvate formate lyase activating enzyme n=1 Tax=Geosmithia morbida TaxID=1094350 RepID=A0A9P4YUE2_9HYPO|nr:putative pyruvate formate lyase activating enzyme [Geosmithia morbida]KAF4122985.1 putative pyruvate formate lyase activating enzyme [Geosmithia morbida]
MFGTLLKRYPPGLTPPGALRRRADRQVVTWGIRGAGAGGAGGAGASRTRSLHLAPPFLLDDYIPRYQLLSSRDAALKRSRAYAHMRSCNLCPRRCGVNRFETTGMCLVGEKAKVNVVAPHFGEESCIQGHNGSGTVFMSGCNLRCTFCQNYDISHKRNGMDLSPEDLAGWYVKLQEVGKVHNINIVTPEHVVPQVALSILHARDMGLRVPIVYNTSSFDSLDSIRLMDGLVDIYLADFKVWKTQSSRRLLKADDYAATARESVKAMHEQVGDLCFTADGIAKRGLLVRHLVMPGKEDEGADIMRFLARDVSQDCFVHIMEQYHPDAYTHGADEQTSTEDAEPQDEVRYAEINRAVNESEISFVRKAAVEAGLWRFEEAPNHAGFPI